MRLHQSPFLALTTREKRTILSLCPAVGWVLTNLIPVSAAQSVESKILTFNDVSFRLSLTLKQTILIFTRQMLNEKEYKLQGDFLSDV